MVGKISPKFAQEYEMLSRPQEYILTSTKSINLFLAGVGSGKTHLGGLLSANFIQTAPKVRGFIGANTYNQLNTSTMFRIREVWRQVFGWEEGAQYVVGKQPPKNFVTDGHNFDRYDGIISFRNGAVCFIGSLDNAKAHDGKEFGWAILDETKDTDEVDVKEVILARLRQRGLYFDSDWVLNTTGGAPFNPLYILTSPAKVQWINEFFGLENFRHEIEAKIYSKGDFFAKEIGDKCVAISSTYHNEPNLPEGYIQKLLDNNSEERGRALVYGNPFTRTGGEFYSGFSAVRHVGSVVYNPALPLHITFDQNVVPYITAGVWQIEREGDGLAFLKVAEFCLPNPNNTTERLCEAILARFSSHNAGAFYYGDASGHSRSTKSPETDYQIVIRVLRKWLSNGSDRTTRSNPPVIKRRDFVNAMLEGKYRIRVVYDGACKHTIADLIYLRQDQNGLKYKERIKDEVSGQTFERYGHTSDADDYFFCVVAPNEFARA